MPLAIFRWPIPFIAGILALRGARFPPRVPLFTCARRGAVRRVKRAPRRIHEAHQPHQRGPGAQKSGMANKGSGRDARGGIKIV